MKALTYHRPQTIDEAIALLQEGVPLAGGTSLVPRRGQLEAVIDLQDLSLDGVSEQEGRLRLGAATPLQTLLQATEERLPALARACRLESALNLRHQATVAGTIHGAGGRSPLLCALLALNPTVRFEPAGEEEPLSQVLEARTEHPQRLATWVQLELPSQMAFESVARSPMDRPLVAAAAVRYSGQVDTCSVALGGFGVRPLMLEIAPDSGSEVVASQAAERYAAANDAWASGEYRSATARVLVGRVLKEVGG